MLPFINTQLNLKFKHLVLNSYISNQENDEEFCILYAWKSDPNFLKFEDELMSNHLFLGHEDYDDKVLYRFRLSKMMLAGREKFLSGQYKDFSDKHKHSIIEYLREARVANLKKITEILSKDVRITSQPPIKNMETFKKNLKTIEHLTEDFKYEGT